jgi:hypothetical protein
MLRASTRPMREVRVSSWVELQDRLFGESWDEALRRYRSRWVFRGCAVDHELKTSLLRLGPRCADLELPLLRTFRKYARWAPGREDNVWCWLALAQHHGLPTRLLDWTFSPYVALHFVTEDAAKFDRDGIVWAVDYVTANQLLPAALQRILTEEQAAVFTGEMLSRAASSLRELDATGEEFVVFFEPPSLDDRIVNQHALFSMMPRADLSPGSWFGRHSELVQRIIVPAALKYEVRDKLDQANVTERVLYPGLDGLCRWLERYYTPRT